MLRLPQNRLVTLSVLLLLCLLQATGALRSLIDLTGSPLPTMTRSAIPLALFAVFALLLNRFRRSSLRSIHLYRQALPVSMGIFIVPAILHVTLASDISSTGRTALLTLVPLFALVLDPYLNGNAPESTQGFRLPAALAGTSGAMLLFPGALPSTGATLIATAATVLSAAAIGAATCRAVALAQSRPRGLAIFVAAESALGLTFASLLFERVGWTRASLAASLTWPALIEFSMDGAAIALFFHLLNRLPATQLAASYLLSPLLAVAIGAALIREPLQPHSWLGLALMALAVVSLIGFRNPPPNSSPHSLL